MEYGGNEHESELEQEPNPEEHTDGSQGDSGAVQVRLPNIHRKDKFKFNKLRLYCTEYGSSLNTEYLRLQVDIFQ
jgi:hypothetical protein